MYKATPATQHQKEKIRNWAELNRYFSKEDMQITLGKLRWRNSCSGFKDKKAEQASDLAYDLP